MKKFIAIFIFMFLVFNNCHVFAIRGIIERLAYEHNKKLEELKNKERQDLSKSGSNLAYVELVLPFEGDNKAQQDISMSGSNPGDVELVLPFDSAIDLSKKQAQKNK